MSESTSKLTKEQSLELQRRLLEVFREFDLDVSIGITQDGISLGSQCPEVNANNLGKVWARPAGPDT